MLRRGFLLTLLSSAMGLAHREKVRLRGTLGKSGVVETAEGRRIKLEGDTETSAVIRDPRLAGTEVEAVGEWAGESRFRVEPVHERGLFALRNGKPLVVTYWCEVCAIRTYSPGICMCCQEETQLDLRDPGKRDVDPASQNTSQ